MLTQTIKNHRNISGDDDLGTWIQSFLAARKSQNLANGTLYFYAAKLKIFSHYAQSEGITNVSQITPPFIREFLLFLERTNHNPGGISTFYRALKTFLRWYEEENEPEEWLNPIKKVKAPKVPEESLQGVTREQLELLLAACGRNSFLAKRNRAILETLYDTRVCASELCNLCLSEMNFADNSIFIRQGKGRKPRFVFFGKSTRRQLRRYLKSRHSSSIWLFVNRSGDKLVYNALRQIVRRLCQETGIEGVGLHSFRHAFCLECLRSQYQG